MSQGRNLHPVVVGDCIEVLRKLPEASIDAVVTDPPYGLEFMGEDWDAPWMGDTRQIGDQDFQEGNSRHGKVRHGMGGSYRGDTRAKMRAYQEWCERWAAECFRVLKPGGYLLAFGGTRTYHRLTAGIEDAGFEIRDQIAWVYGSGFPKNLDVSKAIDKMAGAERPDAVKWDGWGTALKPSLEPICVARKPLEGTVARNVLKYGTGALNIEASRVPYMGAADKAGAFPGGKLSSNRPGEPSVARDDVSRNEFVVTQPDAGRWPGNLIHDGSEEVVGLFPTPKHKGHHPKRRGKGGISTTGHMGQEDLEERHGDVGSASRYFFAVEPDSPIFYCAKPPKSEKGTDNPHPTVKPVNLMRYLVRLVTPPGGKVLDPFCGSGTTVVAAFLEGFRCLGIEQNAEYADYARTRIDAARTVGSEGTDK